MDSLLQLSLLAVSLCLGVMMLLRRSNGTSPARRSATANRPRSGSSSSIDVGPLSTSWLAEQRVKSRID